MIRTLSRRALLALAALGFAQAAAAADFPTRPLTLVVPFAPGGPTDVIGRLVAEGLARRLGQPVVIENVAGAAGTTGVLHVARAQPDGYALVVGNMGTHAAAPWIQRDLAYDPVRSFAPIGLIASTPMLLLASPKGPARDLPSFIAHVRANAGQLNFGSAGVGATSHLACALFNSLIGVTVTHVPYRGTAPVLAGLLSGEIDYGCDQTAGALPQVLGGSIPGIAIATAQRSTAAPDLKTAAEQGLPDFQATAWNALFAPAGTPPEIVARLASALAETVMDPAFAARMTELGAELPEAGEQGPEALARLVSRELERWGGVIQETGIGR